MVSSTSSAASPASEPVVASDASRKSEEEEDDKEECSWCRWMKGGGCKEQFQVCCVINNAACGCTLTHVSKIAVSKFMCFGLRSGCLVWMPCMMLDELTWKLVLQW